MEADAFAEYQLNVDLWKHDDALRQGHNQTFLGVNSAALVAAGLVIAASEKLAVQGATALIAAIFGVAMSWAWRRVQIRHNAYTRYHRMKLAALEAHLSFSTFGDQAAAFFDPWVAVRVGPGDERFEVSAKERASGSVAEARLPVLVMVLWTVAGLAGIAALYAEVA